MFWDVLSTFVGVVGNLQESSSQVKAAVFNSNISRYNAGVTRQQGQLEEDRVRRDARRRIGAIRANVGSSGIDMSGTAEDILSESVYEAELDALSTRYSYQAKASSFEMEAGLYESTAQDAGKAGYINAASTLLKGATKYYENKNDYGAGSTPFKLGGGGGDYKQLSNGEVIRWNK